MQSAKLRRRGLLEKPPETLTSRGARDKTADWAIIDTVYYGRQTVTAGEVIRGRQVHAEATVRLTIRFREDVDSKWRITDGTRQYQFLAVFDPDDRRRELVIDAKEFV